MLTSGSAEAVIGGYIIAWKSVAQGSIDCRWRERQIPRLPPNDKKERRVLWCPIQAVLWLEWDTTALDPPFVILGQRAGWCFHGNWLVAEGVTYGPDGEFLVV